MTGNFKYLFRFSRLLILMILCWTNYSFAQYAASDRGSYKKNFMEGSLLLLEENYVEALKYFQFAYSYDSTNSNINYLIGQCCLKHPQRKHMAEPYLEKAIMNIDKNYMDSEPTEKKAPPMAYLLLGKAYHLDGKFDQALKMYDTYESYIKPKDTQGHKLLKRYKDQVLNAKAFTSAPINIKIKNVGNVINSQYQEICPILTPDERTMYFTHEGPESAGGFKDIDGKYNEDIFVSYRNDDNTWSKPVSISPNINTTGHEATSSLSADGQTLIIYRGDINGGDLYYSTFDGTDWSFPEKFGSNINSEYWEPHAVLSRDGNTLYFASDRPGGMGGVDIYRCVKLPNGQWSLATNLGPPINTEYDDNSPFLGADGMSFYFASSGHQSMGGYDIMMSIIDEEGKFSPPINMGYPINTTDDDIFCVASPDNKRFYFASAHEDLFENGIHDVGFGEEDIYLAYVEEFKSNPMALLKGKFLPSPCDSLPGDIIVVVTNLVNGEIVGQYRPQRARGTFSVIIPPGSKYHFSYTREGKEFYSEDLFISNDIAYEEIQKEINLKPIRFCNGLLSVGDDSTSYKKIPVNITVLNNPKEKKPVQASLFFTARKTGNFTAETDANGKTKNIQVSVDDNFELIASSNGVKSKPFVFTTVGKKTTDVIEKTLYLDGPKEAVLKLNLLVVNSKKRNKPVANASVKMTGTDGSTYEGITDERGRIKDVQLGPNANYELVATKDGVSSPKGVISTQGIKVSRTFEKTLFITASDEVIEVADNSTTEDDCYKFNFKYNMSDLDNDAPVYKEFIKKLIASRDASGKIKLNIYACASTVPTKKFPGGNMELANFRIEQSFTRIKGSLKNAGVAEEDIILAVKKAEIRGPQYKNDAQTNAAVYEKFQFVRVCPK